MSQTLAVGLIIGASLASGVGSTIGNVSSGLGKLKQQSEHLKLGQSIGREYQSLEKEIEKTGTEFQKTGYKSVELGRKMVELEKAKQKARTEAQKYGLNLKNLSKDMQMLGTASKQAEGQIGRVEARMRRAQERSAMRGQLVGTTAAATALLAYPIKAAMGFEAQMSRVGAITKASSEDQARLMESAREQGRKTQFTAAQAAQAQEYLGMAGFKTNEIIAALPGNLSLAAAGQMDLGRTANITSNILNAFSLAAGEANRVADVLAETSTSTDTNVEEMGEAMKYAAPLAKELSVSLEQTAAMVGIMANAGIKGSMGGTALRSSLSQLTSNEGTLKKLKELGVKTRDLQGNLLPLPNILKDIAAKTSNLGTAQKMQAMKAIFGERAVAGMLKIIESAGTGGLDQFVDQLNNCGGAADVMAERMNDNLRGAMYRLGSAVESVAIDLGNGLLPTLAEGAEKLAVFIGKVSEFAGQHPQVSKAIALTTLGFFGLKTASIVGRMGFSYLADGASLANGAFQKLRPSTIQAGLHLMKMRGTGSMAGGVLKTLGGGITSFATGAVKDFKAIGAGIKALGTAIAANPIGAVILGIAIAIGIVWYYWEPIKSAFLKFWPQLKAAWEPIGEGIKKPFVTAFAWIGEKIDWVQGKWQGLKNVLGFGGKGDGVAPAAVTVGASLPGHSIGGIFNQPHIAAFSEGGDEEAVINISKNNQRSQSIWRESGRRMGMLPNQGGGSSSSFGPIEINIYGTPSQSAADISTEVKRVLEDLERKAQRRARGRFADAAVFG